MNPEILNMVRVVEIIGPAGAGKTTLYKALEEFPRQIRLGNFPNVRKMTDAPFFIFNGLKLAGKLSALPRNGGRELTRREFAWMTIMLGWPNLLKRELAMGEHVIVLDQGPVYLMAEMRDFGPEYLKGEAAEKLWQDLYTRWASTLDMIVWLDADNNHLLERIRTRDQEHVVKNSSESTVVDFLERYRKDYQFTVSSLCNKKPELKVLKFDTGSQRPKEILDTMMVEINNLR